MILMVWDSGKARQCAGTIERAMQQPVHLVSTIHDACERLLSAEYAAVLVDQWSTEAEPISAGAFFDHLGIAVPVFVNFGISNEQRILRELHAALSRRALETERARECARQELQDELKDDVTALLLSCGIALEEPALGESARTRLRQIEELAKHMKMKLVKEDEREEQKAVAANA